MKGASSAIKYLKVWQKTAEERRQLVDQEVAYPSYIQPPTSPQPHRSRTATSGSTSTTIDGRKNSSIVSPKFGKTSLLQSDSNNGRKISITTPKQKTTSSSSETRGTYTNDNFTSNDLFDESPSKYKSDFENPAYSWLYEAPVVSIRSDNHPTSNLQSVAELSKMEFNKLPFASYKNSIGNWNPALLQGIGMCLGLTLIPFAVLVIIFMFTKCRFRPKITRVEKRRETFIFLILLFVVLIKDLIFAVLIISKSTNIPLSNSRTICPLCLFLWTLVFCWGTTTMYYYADPTYEFGINPMKKICVQLASHFTFSSLKATALGKVDVQGVYFNKNYPIMSSISCSNEEYVYLKTVTSRFLLITSSGITLILCLIRILPLVYETTLPPFPQHNQTSNISKTTIIVERQYLRIYFCLHIISNNNSFFSFIFFSIWMLYVLLWNTAMLKEWKVFNSNEQDDEKTLINKGPQAVALWWKIRQTFILYTRSSVSMSSLLGKVLVVTCLFVCTVMSLSLVLIVARRQKNVDVFEIISLLVYNLMFYLTITCLYSIFYLIHRERYLSAKLLQLKKLNVGYEVGCLTHLEQEIIDRDPNLRNRLRLLRGRLLLLEEMVTAVSHIDNDDKITAHRLALVIVTSCVLYSSIYTVSSLA